ncbi:MAG: winged helix-turn-helix transcriptional regulator [Actinobacteria bacterium]|nr:MAG: winged helix-turn-helix transcriptional regulator [Actinomycetota bacterium]
MRDASIEHVRHFNRTVSQRVGALSDNFLARHRPMAEARLLWEIGADGCEVRTLRNRLGLDSGHASRLLRALEDDGMARVDPSPSDRRIRVARLTRAGLREWAEIDRRSDEFAASMLEPLDKGDRERLVESMRTVRRLLTAAAIDIREVDPAGPDARQCLRAYVEELNERWEPGFDPSAGVTAEPHELTPPAGCFLVAYLYGEPVGCGGIKHLAGGPSDIKRMWVSPSARGLGLGRRLLGELEQRVRDSGATVARLETNRVLVEAIGLYRSAGYREVPAFNDEPFAHHWFEKPLTT